MSELDAAIQPSDFTALVLSAQRFAIADRLVRIPAWISVDLKCFT